MVSKDDVTLTLCYLLMFSIHVTLLGIREGITYNHSLALRKFGYARRDGPHNTLIQGLVFDY